MHFGTQKLLFLSLTTIATFQRSLQHCPEEVSNSAKKVTWYQSLPGKYIRSDPICINNGTIITRNCTSNGWIPPLNEILYCDADVENFTLPSCPPGFNTISNKGARYCYQIGDPSPWDHPCLLSGGATVITELNRTELKFLLHKLNNTNYRYFWLPAQRHKTFFPMVWLTPGPNWGRIIDIHNAIPFHFSNFKNCLMLDIKEKMLLSSTCSNKYPNLCIYNNNFLYSAKCPLNYHAFRYMINNHKCFGIEKSETNMTFQEFLDGTCKTPMGNGQHVNNLPNIYSKIAAANKFPDDMWCWFAAPTNNSNSNNSVLDLYGNNPLRDFELPRLSGVISNNGSIALMDPDLTLPCMACEASLIYNHTEFSFEYNVRTKQLYLIVYFPSGLWKYSYNDRGVQCFTDADGLSRVIDVHDLSIVDVVDSELSDESSIEKIVYVIKPVTHRSARYWCEGHTKSLSLITTNKILVNPHGDQVHVFALVIKTEMRIKEHYNLDLISSNLISNITCIFKPRKALVMDVLEYNLEMVQFVIHLHVAVNYTSREDARKLQTTLESLQLKADVEFPKYNYILVNIASALYCLPTTSINSLNLTWDLTPIGHIAAPLQFCLQENGLPVNRQCHGSYILGSSWGRVEGQCDVTYLATNITRFLFEFVKGRRKDFISDFLTTGLKFVLKDLNILIPADIYYLSVSLQYILFVGRTNFSWIETGDIENMAWVMNRVMSINSSDLRLAQTLNSTNAILESTSNLIELIAVNNITTFNNLAASNGYQVATQPRFIVQVSYPEICNITGIAVIKNKASNIFTDMTIIPLYKNTTLRQVLSLDNLEVATWLPHYIVDNLQHLNNDTRVNSTDANSMHIVIKLYTDTAVFQELGKNNHVVNSRIIEITFPDYDSNLGNIPLIFRNIDYLGFNNTPRYCGYWDFQTENGNIPGTWSQQGCFLRSTMDNLTICECNHMTHFAQLLNIRSDIDSETYAIDEKHERALNIITLIGSFLSLIGIAGIWITATVFDSWRKKIGTKVLLQLSISIALPLILIIIFNLDSSIIVESEGWFIVPNNMVTVCVGLGALFHYSVLANFTWMLITAILQFIRYVRVLGVSRPSKFMIKIALVGWGSPFIPVIIVLLLDYENYIPSLVTSRSFCYPTGIYLIMGLVVPVCVVLLINIVLFLLVIKSISKSTKMQVDKNLIFAQFRLSIFLFFLLGLTWIFGVASFSGQLIWSYLFCLTSTVQGLVLFVYFIICDPNTRKMWIAVMKPQFTRSKDSISTIG